MPGIRTRVIFSTLLLVAFTTTAHAVTLDRAPEILLHRPMGPKIQLLWSPGGDSDGTLHDSAATYTLQRQIGAQSTWHDRASGATLMTYEEDVGGLISYNIPQHTSWWVTMPALKYRVYAKTTSDNVKTYSQTVTINPSLPMWVQEVHDGELPDGEMQDNKARVSWVASEAPSGFPVHLGYVVQKLVGFSWVDQTGYLSTLTWVDPNTTIGTANSYRVRTVYDQIPTASVKHSRLSNTQSITIQSMCDGLAANPYVDVLIPIDIVDQDSDGYDGDDIAAALYACEGTEYEDLEGPGDHDGIYEPGNPELPELPLYGGCVLRALPVTYENVAIMITNSADACDDVSAPLHCLPLNFPAGLVIEGQGRESVFRGPVRPSGYDLPASVLEVFRRTFPITLRNLVLDGRKHDQVAPDTGSFVSWPAHGFHVWSQTAKEIAGDGLGTDNEACEEADFWPTTPGCINEIYTDNGCIHNVEVRNTLFHGIAIDDARGWIIEDSEIHDTGCVNRGYGFDCPYFDAPDAGPQPVLPGLKMPAVGMSVGNYTSDFQIRRNQFYRTAKYGLSFKNGGGTHCNGLMEDHEASYNHLHHLGSIGIFGFGLVGARIHHNIIDGTTTFGDTTLNAVGDTFGMSLGGYCVDDNEISDNWIVNSGGLAISWSGSSETDQCTPSGCAPITPPVVGNTISGNLIDSTCLEKDAAPGSDPEDDDTKYRFGAIHMHGGAGGDVFLTDNTLINSGCRFAISAFGGTEPLNLSISGGSYESGDNAGESEFSPDVPQFYSGALHAHGEGRTIVVHEDTTIENTSTTTIPPKVSAALEATVVIRDANPAAPFNGPFDVPHNVGNTATIIECSATDDHPNPEEPDPPIECQ